jgi:hypothetical protein
MTQQPLSEQTTINSTLRAEDTLHEKSPAALEDAKPANPPQGPAMTFPDGGLQAWSVVAGPYYFYAPYVLHPFSSSVQDLGWLYSVPSEQRIRSGFTKTSIPENS